MKSIREIPLHHQTVFLRLDYNVPLDAQGKIADDGRITAALPTVEYLIEKEARIVIASHLGRPKGKRVRELSLEPVAERLSKLLGQDIHFVDDCIGREVDAAKQRLKPSEVLLLENLRFNPLEEANDLVFAEHLAEGIDVYINDAFGTIHRKHASIVALPSLVFDKGVGFLIQKEIEALDKIRNDPDQPFVMVIGGIKMSDKVAMVKHLAPLADLVLLGGGVSNAFLKAQGHDVGTSLLDEEAQESAEEIWKEFETEHSALLAPNGSKLGKIQPPIDVVAAPNREEGSDYRVLEMGKENVPAGWMFLDIGPKTQRLYASLLAKAKTIFWNGPMGLFEMDEYAKGTRTIAQAIADADAYAVLGGGDTETVVDRFGLRGRFSHLSTGGGASLAYLAGKELPGLAALE